MRDVVFMGCRGYTRNYGGWETFLRNLIDNWKEPETHFYVFELTHDKNEKKVEVVNGVTCIRIFVKKAGSGEMMSMDLKTLRQLKKVSVTFKLNNPILYVMGARVGILFWLKKRKIKKCGYRIVFNPAGLEWKRKKFNLLIRLHSYIARIFFNKAADWIVCDSQGILDIYRDTFKLYKKNMAFIAYGTYKAQPLEKRMPNKVEEYFKKNGIVPNNYYLVLGRLVAENNYELIISEFMKSDTKKDLVVICNKDKESKYYNKLLNMTKFDTDKRIKFVGTMYDKVILNYLRQYAHAYIHGHSVGGTNPGLLEALSTTNVCLLNDVVFNRQVGEDCAFYFGKDYSLNAVMKKSEELSEKEKIELGDKAKARMSREYSWEKIVNQYSFLFDEILS